MSVADRRSGGVSTATSAKTIACTPALVAPNATATAVSVTTLGAAGMKATEMPPISNVPTRTRRSPSRSPSGPAPGEASAPTNPAVPTTRPMALARPAPVPTRRSTRIGR